MQTRGYHLAHLTPGKQFRLSPAYHKEHHPTARKRSQTMANLLCLSSVCSSSGCLLAGDLNSAFRSVFASFGNCRAAWLNTEVAFKKGKSWDLLLISSLNISASLKILPLLTGFQYVGPPTELCHLTCWSKLRRDFLWLKRDAWVVAKAVLLRHPSQQGLVWDSTGCYAESVARSN